MSIYITLFAFAYTVTSFSFIPSSFDKIGINVGNLMNGQPSPDGFEKRTDVLCIGEVLYDCIADVDCNGLKFDEVYAANKWTKFPGGAPANVACGLAKLGVRSMFAGAIGNDDDGKELSKLFGDLKVETLCSVSNLPTRRVQVERNDLGDRVFSGFWKNIPTENFADCYYNPPVSAKWLVETSALAVVMGTLGLYPMSSSTSSIMRGVADILKSRPENVPTKSPFSSNRNPMKFPLLVVDLNIRPVFWSDTPEDIMKQEIMSFAQGSDLIKLTDEEAEWITGVSKDRALQNPDVLMPFLSPNIGILVTGGDKGASYYIKDVGSSFLPAFSIKCVETTGAGDAFTAGFLAAIAMDAEAVLCSKAGADRALLMACAAGALTCTNEGAISSLPSLPEVINLMITSPMKNRLN